VRNKTKQKKKRGKNISKNFVIFWKFGICQNLLKDIPSFTPSQVS